MKSKMINSPKKSPMVKTGHTRDSASKHGTAVRPIRYAGGNTSVNESK